MNEPKELHYAPTHEWATSSQDGVVTVGITDFAQDQLGDVVYVELPESGLGVGAGDSVAVVESVKTASDIYSPVPGTITDVNEALLDSPELINSDPYGDGWLFRVRLADEAALGDLLTAESYRANVSSES